ncbi:prolipoprotein diacylglyceryl transferase [Gordonia jinghuaiqii]|uniref:Phosphatidylglycerol--prolipoprotein diacylglyceryl transferase n=1 Tax=Gordonia jinghuaiqii TaxID=2758710 RepID=A0A7D7R8B9_9ACTN|nr:prolipoprotein diacylglyceryl transferase [Gordonia jinghuaiqii]MCR5977326.1 prolipoprotein diacylglyceryl transferase [Gordonia jinghuaiqii]QMT00090.1 prolipoprotein diacylglyceryl transferase [Gordonia jinghuaiqii]
MIAPSSTLLAYIPSPPQGVWEIGPFPLRAYALCIIAGIVIAVWWGNRRWVARGGQDGEVLDVAIWAVPFGLIGGRVYHVITDWKTYFGADALKEPADVFRIWDGGLGIWGAVALGAVGAWIGARRRGIRLPAFGDAIAPPILLAQAIGRLGNYFNQELYGRETTLPWGLEIFERENSAGYADPGLIDGVSNGVVDRVVHPTFLYELLWNVLIVVVLVVLDRRFRIGHGRLFALYVAGYCLGRFFVEMLRDDRAAVANDIAGIRPNLFTAALVFLAAIIYFVVAPKGREQGLEMYHEDRAAELEEQGIAGYVDDWYDEELDDEVPAAVEPEAVEPEAVESEGVESDAVESEAVEPAADEWEAVEPTIEPEADDAPIEPEADDAPGEPETAEPEADGAPVSVPETTPGSTGSDAESDAEATADEATTEQATTEQATTEQATTEQVATEQATPDEATPDEATPDEATRDETTPEAVTPEEATSDEVTPEAATPDQATPDDSNPDEATPDAAPVDEVSGAEGSGAEESGTDTAGPEVSSEDSDKS